MIYLFICWERAAPLLFWQVSFGPRFFICAKNVRILWILSEWDSLPLFEGECMCASEACWSCCVICVNRPFTIRWPKNIATIGPALEVRGHANDQGSACT